MFSILIQNLRHMPQVIRQETSALMEEFRLFAGLGNGSCVFRQSRIDGMRALVKAGEDVGRSMYFYGQFEAEDSAFLWDNIRESDICVDIGANVGFYTLGLAKRACRGAVHSFEPVPVNYHVLALNVLSNNLPNVVVNHCAVGDTDGEVEFCVAQDGAFSSLVDTGRKAIVATLKTRIIKLDSYCSEHNLPRVDILKVDVEGAEPLVLRGASGLLTDRERRPRLIMLELFDPMLRLFGSTRREIEALMRTYGYDAFAVVKGKLARFSELHHEEIVNIVFLDPNRMQAPGSKGL